MGPQRTSAAATSRTGARWRWARASELDFKIAGRVTELTYEVTEYDRPERVRLFCDAGWFTSDDTIEVAPDGAGSAVTYTAIVKMKGVLGLFDPIMQLGFNRAGKQAAEGLRETLAQRR